MYLHSCGSGTAKFLLIQPLCAHRMRALVLLDVSGGSGGVLVPLSCKPAACLCAHACLQPGGGGMCMGLFLAEGALRKAPAVLLLYLRGRP